VAAAVTATMAVTTVAMTTVTMTALAANDATRIDAASDVTSAVTVCALPRVQLAPLLQKCPDCHAGLGDSPDGDDATDDDDRGFHRRYLLRG
jgi:hypothetical protein